MKLLSSCCLFNGLSESQLIRLSEITKEIQIDKGQFFMKEGGQANELFVLKKGAFELMIQFEDGFELPIAIFRDPGDCAGLSSLVAPYVYSLHSRCVEDSKMMVINKTAFKTFMQEEHALEGCIMKNLAKLLLDRLKATRKELKIHCKTIFKSTQPSKTEGSL